ncbi:MAG TPA: HDOD domain-containing protein [Methylococcaceae bacterium]|jgi:HD-like signal output (HDOD) protein|nr:HDOD domain-containing protein [Methylococcaceae bacterium]
MVPEDLLESDVRLFSLPSIVLELNLMISTGSARDIARLVSQDVGLTARLLRIANSASYGLRDRIDNIHQAVAVVGMNDLANLVLATVAVRRFARIRQDLVDMEEFWRRSVLAGVAARILAEETHVTHPERLFVAGLLHDIGSLILYCKEPERSQAILLEAGGDRSREAELQRGGFGFTFADLGAALMRHWNLPELMEHCIQQQLTPLSSEQHSPESRLIRISTQLIDRAYNDMGLEECQALVEREAAEKAPVTPEILARTFESLPEHVSTMYGNLFG